VLHLITIFNRKELYITYSMEEQARIRNLLSSHNIDYTLSTLSVYDILSILANTMQSSPRGAYGRRDFNQTQYRFYVKKSDYDEALAIMNKK